MLVLHFVSFYHKMLIRLSSMTFCVVMTLSFASLLLSEGETPVYAKAQLGHSRIKTTVDIYGHWIQTKSKTGVNRLDTVAPACILSAPKQENPT